LIGSHSYKVWQKKKYVRFWMTLILGCSLALVPAAAQINSTADSSAAEFRFTRLAYESNALAGYGRRGRSKWQTDWPEAEDHLAQGIDRLTRVDVAKEGHVVSALSDDLFDYPWLYAVEVGHWTLTATEAERLREYLLRGGFLVVDDFHGTFEWSLFKQTLRSVFPDRPIVDIADTDEVFHTHFDLDHRTQIPSRRVVYTGQTWESDGITPHWRGIYDDDGRLMIAINFNMDLGDAWEHADWPDYPQALTALAYRFGVNYVIYAMTH
jgi:hypothetical protein